MVLASMLEAVSELVMVNKLVGVLASMLEEVMELAMVNNSAV